ncbi:hypothetical protein CHS0354_024766 [Potamilus streckersoni]|uniref:Uncharacterized protein n=1 Tax=Potamilus streckersoni TaxID=2493646 RepID=A0AAE0RX75_9BIVA|nr:hypothetical protein CHS0354_024766 [Potamilus streckersoni]
MTLFDITLLLGLAVLVSGYPMTPGYGPGTFTNGIVGQGLDGFRNFGNLDFDNRCRLWDSQNIGGSVVVDGSFVNSNGRGLSSTNMANIYGGQNIFRDQLGGLGWDGSSGFGTWDNGQSARQGNIPNNVGYSVLDRSIGNINGIGATAVNRADIYDSSGSFGNGNPGKISGDVFRSFSRDGTELGGFLLFE